MSEEKLAEQLLGKIESIVKGEEVELSAKKVDFTGCIGICTDYVENLIF